MRNDFSVWGTRITSTGIELPIHARYAIDKKPEYYKSLKTGKIYIAPPNNILEEEFIKLYPDGIVRDWRELIYQMAVDYFLYNQDVDFLSRLIKANTVIRKNENQEFELY